MAGDNMVSTRGRYALLVMLDLAEQESGRYTPLAEIANRHGLSQKYLEIIIKELVRHKLLKGLRGKRGGYILPRLPQEYTVGEILELTEGKFAMIPCADEYDEPGDGKDYGYTLPMWQEFERMTHDYFWGITLADLLAGYPYKRVECSV